MRSNPGAVYWMDINFFQICLKIDFCKKCIVCLKRSKINEKEAGVGPFLKKLENHLYKGLFDTTTSGAVEKDVKRPLT